MTRLLNVMVPGNLALHLDFDGYVPQVILHERALLRVCQEAVSNVIRHAEARRVKVAVRIDDRRVHLRVHDDGRALERIRRADLASRAWNGGSMRSADR